MPVVAPKADARHAFMKTVLTAAAAGTAVLAATATRSQARSPTYLPQLYRGWNARNFHEIEDDENQHVDFLRTALGATARPMPTFQDLDHASVLAFAMLSETFENVGVGAYLGALPLLVGFNSQYTQPAATIALIEARHAGYLSTLLDDPITMNSKGNAPAFEAPLTPQEVVTDVSPFVANLNGGPPLIPAGGFTTDVQVLNLALALKYREATFYNLNVPRPFGAA